MLHLYRNDDTMRLLMKGYMKNKRATHFVQCFQCRNGNNSKICLQDLLLSKIVRNIVAMLKYKCILLV